MLPSIMPILRVLPVVALACLADGCSKPLAPVSDEAAASPGDNRPAQAPPSAERTPEASTGHFIAVLESERESGPREGADPDIIRRTIRGRIGAVKRCYDEGLARDPNIRGRVVVSFQLSEDGATKVESVEDGLGAPEVARCIGEVIQATTFPRPATGPLTISYPFVLEPG